MNFYLPDFLKCSTLEFFRSELSSSADKKAPREKTQSNACRKSQYIHQTEPRLLASQKQERLVLTCPVTQKRGLCPKKVDDMQPPQCSLVIIGIPSWQLSWSTFTQFSARACCETISHERLLVTVCRVQ